jgi:hypothetical protein
MIKKVYVQIATLKQARYVPGAENVTLAIVKMQRRIIDLNNFIMSL